MVSSILPKNERKQFDLRYHSSKVEFFSFIFWENWRYIPKRHFEINWPLASEFICLFHFKITYVLYAIVFIVRSKLWVYRNSVWLEELRSNSWGKWSWPEHRLEEKNLEQFSRPHEMSVRTCLKFKMKPKKRRERSVFRPAESLKMHSWNSWI